MQLSVLIVATIGFVLAFATLLIATVTPTTPADAGPSPSLGFFFVGFFLILGERLVALIAGIVASDAAPKSKFYRYKGIIPFVKA